MQIVSMQSGHRIGEMYGKLVVVVVVVVVIIATVDSNLCEIWRSIWGVNFSLGRVRSLDS